MNRFALSRRSSFFRTKRRGYTLVEILVATTLSLLILGAVVQLFAKVGAAINESRAILESADRLRATQNLLQADLEGLTVTPIPPRRTDDNEGYLEIIKGAVVQTQVGPAVGTVVAPALRIPSPNLLPLNTTSGSAVIDPNPINLPYDSTVGALGNILMFTTRSKGKPFTGRQLVATGATTTEVVVAESDVAEVAYFLRGKNLHRRVLLVAPSLTLISQPNKTLPWIANGAPGFYADNDISVRWVNPNGTADGAVLANTLGDLSRRECRFAHPLASVNSNFDIRPTWLYLGLPTLQECSDLSLRAGKWDAAFFTIVNQTLNAHWNNLWSRRPDIQALPNPYVVDFWSPEPLMNFSASELTNLGTRTADDLVLTNVLSFDIKVWDAGYPILQSTVTGKVLKPGDAGYILPGDAGYPGNTNYTVLGFGGYVDLGYSPNYNPARWNTTTHPLPCAPPPPNFSGLGNPTSPLAAANLAMPRVYDTWSNTYDNVPDPNFPGISVRPNDGFDNRGLGIVDNDLERAFPTPYSAPLRGIQVIIRIYEPDSRQIREVTIEQDFLPK